MDVKYPLLRATLLIGLGSLCMYFGAMSLSSTSLIGGHLIPSNADAFYHARRILDAATNGAPVMQFDPRMHVPEGSWVTWPWGYDQVMAWLLSLFGPFASEADAFRVLAKFPLAFIPIAITLVVVLARQLNLSLAMSLLAVLTYALIPMDFTRFSTGNLDHHFAEQLWTLLLLNAAVWMMRKPGNVVAPILLGAAMGSGVAVQNGLFILQVLLVLALLVAWFRGLPLPSRSRLYSLALSLLAVTLAVCIPSQPWRNGFFDFYLLSWFHVYVAAVCAGYIVWMAHARPSSRVIMAMVAAGLATLVPVFAQIAYGLQFASGNLTLIRDIQEAKSPYALYFQLGPEYSTRLFTWLMWAAMPALLLNLWWACRSRQSQLVVFAVISCVLLALLQSQFRFGVLGVMSLVFTPVLAMEQWAEKRPELARPGKLALTLLFIACFLPTRGFFAVRWAPADELAYGAIYEQLQALGEHCRSAPGVVLAQKDSGHWIRYHTECSVISNVFLLTPQHLRKVQETADLLAMQPAELRARRPDVKYVLAYISIDRAVSSGLGQPTQADIQKQLAHEPRLFRELLGGDPPMPEGFRELSAAASSKGGVYARLFEVSPSKPKP